MEANEPLSTRRRNRRRAYMLYTVCSATCVNLGHRAIADTNLYAAAFKPNSWPAAKMPLRLSSGKHSIDMRNGGRNWMLKTLVFYWQNHSRSRIGSSGEGRTGNDASLKDHRPPWHLPACPSFAGCTGTNACCFDVLQVYQRLVSRPCLDE
ncbi:hypothetical protein HDV63DRAFT_43459 [Trichoderma sp. SZMC 28014]